MKCVAMRALYLNGIMVQRGEVLHLTEAKAAPLIKTGAVVQVGKDKPPAPKKVDLPKSGQRGKGKANSGTDGAPVIPKAEQAQTDGDPE